MILQNFSKEMVTDFERKPIRISNWRYISYTLGSVIDEIHVCINYFIYSIFDLSPSEFYKLSNNPTKNLYKNFKLQRGSLLCSVCNGRGTVDWIKNVTLESRTAGQDSKAFVRDRKGKINIYSTETIPKKIFYLSSPQLRKGENYCRKCHGSGILTNYNTVFERSIEPKELERNIMYSYK
jgi:hypothetical protein